MTTAIATTNYKTITSEDIYNLLVNVTKSTIIDIVYHTNHKFATTVSKVKQVTKVSQVKTAFINHDYSGKVINKLNKEAKALALSGKTAEAEAKFAEAEAFKSQGLKGKIRISSTILQGIKNGDYMVDLKVETNVPTTTIALFDAEGNKVTKAEAEARELFTPKYYEPYTPYMSGRGAMTEENNFQMRTPKLDNIVMFKFNGQWYINEERKMEAKLVKSDIDYTEAEVLEVA